MGESPPASQSSPFCPPTATPSLAEKQLLGISLKAAVVGGRDCWGRKEMGKNVGAPSWQQKHTLVTTG